MKSRNRISLTQTCLASALGLFLASTAVYGQSTTSNIFGQVPAQSGESIVIRGTTGLTRTVKVNDNGRYNAIQLPVGTYSVTLMRDGKEIQARDNVVLQVGIGADVSFSSAATSPSVANATQLSAIHVTANAIPPIDVSTVDSHTIITAEQLAKLPLARSAEAAALLAPAASLGAGGATSTTGAPLISFGGSSATENAYYVNGFNTTDPFNAYGGLTLPYGSISQEEAYTGGYSAQYGRSDGGVISMIGKSGTNEWHFGGQAIYAPQTLRSNQRDTYYKNGLPPNPVAGRLYDPNSADTSSETTYDLYLGGPLIKDKLFLFASMEKDIQNGTSVNNVESGTASHYRNSTPKWYVNVDWNVTDNSVLEITGASDERKTNGSLYNYDYANQSDSGFKALSNQTKQGGHMWSGKFTDYLTDSLTLNAMYGKMTTYNFSEPAGYDPSLTYLGNTSRQNPALNGGTPITNAQVIQELQNLENNYTTSNLRLGLSYVIGSHTITVGIDNLVGRANNQVQMRSGPGYSWGYGFTTNPGSPLAASLGVGAPANYPNGATGYYVTKGVYNVGGNLMTNQKAQYIQDEWQVSDRWLVSLGLRNSSFDNTNDFADSYMKQTKPQWAPRLGVSWDVYGDSSFKVFGNVGRYFLGQPLAPGGAANSQTITSQYFTYSGIAADGTPTGLTPMSGPVDPDNRFGQPVDTRTVTAQNIKAQDQDEYILGFSKTAGPKWVYGAKLTRRNLRHVIDDYCDAGAVVDAAAAQGITDVNNATCYYINPGIANTFSVSDPSGVFHNVIVTRAQMRFPPAMRRYYALDTFLEHPFDGHWYGKVSYTFSRLYGNSEGQGESDIRAIGGNQNTDWDFPALMVYAGGPQGNDHTNVIKAFGYYQINPQWLVSGNLNLTSGGPKYCLGLYGTNPLDTSTNDPDGYGSTYHWCNGKPSPPGAGGRLPWMKQLDLGVQYRPAFADRKLAFHLNVFNVFNDQAPLNLQSQLYSDSTGTQNPTYGTPFVLQPPRYVRMSVTYDY